MGHKVNPISLRLGITEDWRSRWYARKNDFGRFLIEDHKIRGYVHEHYRPAGINKIEIERTREIVRVILEVARPGIIIGRSGTEIERLREQVEVITGQRVDVQVREISRPEAHAALIAESIAQQLSKRASFKRTIKRAAEAAMESGVKGVRIRVSGRLGGSEMARSEEVRIGSIPLHTLRAKVDYGFVEAMTKAGHIGIKVWTYTGLQEDSDHAADA